MPPKVDIWNVDAEYKLIEMVKNKSILWDTSLPAYRRTDLEELEWEQIAAGLGLLYSCEAVKKRWANIRGTFQDNHRKVENSRRSGTDPTQIYVPRWPLYSTLKFLESTMKTSTSSSNLKPPESAVQQEQLCVQAGNVEVFFDENFLAYSANPEDTSGGVHCQSSNDSVLIHDPPESPFVAPKRVCLSSPLGSGQTSGPPSTSPPPRPSSAPVNDSLFKKRGGGTTKKSSNDAVVEEALSVMKKVVDQPLVIPQKDRVDNFCSYIASVLREMSPADRTLSEIKIMEALFSSHAT